MLWHKLLNESLPWTGPWALILSKTFEAQSAAVAATAAASVPFHASLLDKIKALAAQVTSLRHQPESRPKLDKSDRDTAVRNDTQAQKTAFLVTEDRDKRQLKAAKVLEVTKHLAFGNCIQLQELDSPKAGFP